MSFSLFVFVTCVPSPSRAHTFGHSSISGVLPPEETRCAAAFGLASRTECAPGSGPGSKAASCGQQALPHQQGPPCTPLGCSAFRTVPVTHPALFPHWRSLGSGNAGAGDQGILNDLCPCYQEHLLYLLLAVQGTHGLEPCLSCPFWFHRWIALWVVW